MRAVELVILVKPIGILTCPNEHLFRKKNPTFLNISSKGCRDKCGISCFKILDHASIYPAQLKRKESVHIEQLKPELNKQVEQSVVAFVNLSGYCFAIHS